KLHAARIGCKRCGGAPRARQLDLHSFPTRRSCDLDVAADRTCARRGKQYVEAGTLSCSQGHRSTNPAHAESSPTYSNLRNRDGSSARVRYRFTNSLSSANLPTAKSKAGRILRKRSG